MIGTILAKIFSQDVAHSLILGLNPSVFNTISSFIRITSSLVQLGRYTSETVESPVLQAVDNSIEMIITLIC